MTVSVKTVLRLS